MEKVKVVAGEITKLVQAGTEGETEAAVAKAQGYLKDLLAECQQHWEGKELGNGGVLLHASFWVKTYDVRWRSLAFRLDPVAGEVPAFQAGAFEAAVRESLPAKLTAEAFAPLRSPAAIAAEKEAQKQEEIKRRRVEKDKQKNKMQAKKRQQEQRRAKTERVEVVVKPHRLESVSDELPSP